MKLYKQTHGTLKREFTNNFQDIYKFAYFFSISMKFLENEGYLLPLYSEVYIEWFQINQE